MMEPPHHHQQVAATFTPSHTVGNVLCCLCGVSIAPNPAGMCALCIRGQVDITEGIGKQHTVIWCKQCGRYLQPPKHWLKADLESKELLTYCIKRVKGLSKVKLVDAGFVWTEPSSRRIKVKLTVQGEVLNGAILQQSFVVEYMVQTNHCPDCARLAANPNSWQACVQVRQHVEHKRTFFFLEQLILKHSADSSCVNVRDIHEGVDFYFSNRSHATKFVDFLQSVVPIRFRHDKQLVSHNTHDNTYNYRFTFSVEIVPVCKDDLVCLPPKLFASLGNIGPVVLVSRVTNAITYTDPRTGRYSTIEAPAWWRVPLRPLLSSKQLVSYMVLDIEARGGRGEQQPGTGKWQMADVQLAKMSDFGVNDRTFHGVTHLGHVLHPGDIALGYDLASANFVDDDLERYVNKGLTLPDVVLVRKSYEERRRAKRNKPRAWKLRRLAMEVEDGPTATKERRDGSGEARAAQDMERFLEELEEDPDMRSRVALYRDKQALEELQRQQQQVAGPPGMGSDDEDEDEDGSGGGLPQVPLEELLDDLEALTLSRQHGGQHGGSDDWGEAPGDADEEMMSE